MSVNDKVPETGNGSFALSDKDQYFDSSQFHVKRLYSSSGLLAFESLTDTINNLTYEKYLDTTGKVLREGRMNSLHNFHVGIWKYNTDDGKQLVLDFDTTKQVSYFQAKNIAKRHGYSRGRLEVDEVMIDRIIFWKAIDWSDENAGGGSGRYILIRRSTGKVTTPKDNRIEYFD